MRTLANAAFYCAQGVSSYLATLVVNIVNAGTRQHGGSAGWVTDGINAGRIDYFYHAMAVLTGAIFVYLLAGPSLRACSQGDGAGPPVLIGLQFSSTITHIAKQILFRWPKTGSPTSKLNKKMVFRRPHGVVLSPDSCDPKPVRLLSAMYRE